MVTRCVKRGQGKDEADSLYIYRYIKNEIKCIMKVQ